MIVKNTTGVTKIWGGNVIGAGAQYTVQEVDKLRLLSDATFLTDLASGAAVINNDVRDLSAGNGLLTLQGRLARASITTFHNGTVGNNQWLGYSEVLPGNQVPIRIPWDCYLKELSISYAQSNLLGIPLSGEQIDGKLQIYKNGLTAPRDVVHTEQFTNLAAGKIIDGLSIPLSRGDFIVSRWVDQGDNPRDMAIVYFFLLR